MGGGGGCCWFWFSNRNTATVNVILAQLTLLLFSSMRLYNHVPATNVRGERGEVGATLISRTGLITMSVSDNNPSLHLPLKHPPPPDLLYTLYGIDCIRIGAHSFRRSSCAVSCIRPSYAAVREANFSKPEQCPPSQKHLKNSLTSSQRGGVPRDS